MNDAKHPKHPIPSRCDVVVIGAGPAGLTAAAVLSKAGLDTIVLETQDQPGGYFTVFERKGFVFDSSIQWLNQCQPGGFVHDIFNYLGPNYPACKPLVRIHRNKSASIDYLLTSDPLKLQDRLIEDFPKEEPGIRRYFEDCRWLGIHVKKLNARTRTPETMSVLERVIYGLKMLRWVLPIRKYLSVSPDKGLSRYFTDPTLREIFCSEPTFMSTLMRTAWASTKDYQIPPKGGSRSIIAWLGDIIESQGARVLLNQRVKSVLVENGNTVKGVVTEQGSTVMADYVIAACDVATLYNEMLPSTCTSRRLRNATSDADVYESMFSVFLGLDCDVASLGFGEEMTRFTEDGRPRAEHSSGDPHKTCLMMLAPTVRDPSMAPAGKGILTIYCPADIHYKNNWECGDERERGDAYKALKKAFADVLVTRVEKAFGINLRRHIEVMETATPITYWRYTGNRNGSIMGTQPTRKNIRRRLAGYRTPVKNLLLSGHWAEYGGGLPLAVKAGVNAALMILQKTHPPAFSELKTVLDNV